MRDFAGEGIAEPLPEAEKRYAFGSIGGAGVVRGVDVGKAELGLEALEDVGLATAGVVASDHVDGALDKGGSPGPIEEAVEFRALGGEAGKF